MSPSGHVLAAKSILHKLHTMPLASFPSTSLTQSNYTSSPLVTESPEDRRLNKELFALTHSWCIFSPLTLYASHFFRRLALILSSIALRSSDSVLTPKTRMIPATARLPVTIPTITQYLLRVFDGSGWTFWKSDLMTVSLPD
jgi:hypothetical protein